MTNQLKPFFTCLLVQLSLVGNSQVSTAIYQGRTVNIVPYRLESGDFEADIAYDDYAETFERFQIPFIPDSLADGEYILYYAVPERYYHRWEHRKCRKIKPDTDSLKIAAVFNVKHNKKHGPVEFYDYYYQKKPSATGHYEQDIKDGLWTVTDRKEIKQITATYQDGKMEGLLIKQDLRFAVKDVCNYVNGNEIELVDTFSSSQAMYQGKPVTICQYRVQYGDRREVLDQDTFVISKYEVREILSKLEDGTYVMEYKAYPDLTNIAYTKQLYRLKQGSIAYYFTVKDHQYNGMFYEYAFGTQHLNKRNNKKAVYSAQLFNGQLHGISAYYHKGKLISESEYINGKRDGQEKIYRKGKLVQMDTYKRGVRYGEFFNKTSKKSYERGFIGSNGYDSIREIVYKNGNHVKYTNAYKPFKEIDSAERDWYFMPVLYLNASQIATTPYTKHEVFNGRGKLKTTDYLLHGNRKVPYVELNKKGDTLEYAYRGFGDDNSKEAIVIRNFYEKKRLLSSSKYIYRKNLKGQYDRYSKGRLISTTSYNAETRTESFSLKNDNVYWNGWLTKRDSNIVTNQKTGLTHIQETYDVKNLGSFVVYNNQNIAAFILRFNSTTRHYRFIYPDTVEVTNIETYGKLFTTTTVNKVCLSDELNTKSFEFNYTINPFKPHAFENRFLKLTGKHIIPVYYDGNPFTGQIVVQEVYAKRRDKNNAIVHVEESINRVVVTRTTSKLVKKGKYSIIPSPPLQRYVFNYKDGVLHGRQKCWTDQVLVFELNFDNGFSSGKQVFRRGPVGHNGQYSDSVTCFFENKLLNGAYTIFESNGGPLLQTHYSNGLLHGPYQEFDRTRHGIHSSKRPIIQTHFNRDSLHGQLILFQHGLKKELVTFNNGKATGPYENYRIAYIDRTKSDSVHHFRPYYVNIPVAKANLNSGAFADTVYGYFKDGALKYMAVKWKQFNHAYIKQKNQDEWIYIIKGLPKSTRENVTSSKTSIGESTKLVSFGTYFNRGVKLNLDPLEDKMDGVYTFYYKSGSIAQKGFMQNGKRTGKWSYWSENGVLKKTVVWSTDSYNQPKYIRTYYPNGNLLMTGRVISQEQTYHCETELEVPLEHVAYTSYYDNEGNDIYRDGNCEVVEFHLNGSIRYRGQIVDKLHSGIWKYYTPDGTLTEIGEYVEGRKHGKWLKGDLSGINYLENACSMDEALSIIKERQQKNIDIEEIQYESGTPVSSFHHSLQKL